LFDKFGLQRLAFLTLIAHEPNPWEKSQRRFKSLQTHILKPTFTAWIVIADVRTQPVRYQILAACSSNARQLSSELTARLRLTLPNYGFILRGLIPVRNRSGAITQCVRSYVSTSLHSRSPEQKGARIVRYSQGWRCASAQFAWNTTNGWLWRAKLARFAASLGAKELSDLKRICGARWAYLLGQSIMAIELDTYPSLDHTTKDDWIVASEKDTAARVITVNGKSKRVKLANDTSPKLPARIVAQVALRNTKK